LKIRRLAAIGAALVAGALALSACSGGSGGGSEVVSGTAVSVAQNSAMTTMNSFTSAGYATYNSNIAYMYQSTFNYYNNTPALVQNTKFGTYKKVSDKPLTIKYTINDGVKWTDGTKVDAADMLLQWASSLTKYNKEGAVNFGSINQGGGTDLISKTPTIGDGGRSLTVVYDKPYVDWEPVTVFSPNLAAHIVWEVAGIDKSTGDEAKKKLIKAIQDNDTATLTTLAKTWKSGFDMTSTPKDKRLLVTDGAYKVTSLTKQYVTLEANKDYTWGPTPSVAKITVRFIPDQTAQVQALQNGEIGILYGQATQDTVKALKGIKNVKSTTSPTATFEHVDLRFANHGPFDPASYGGDAAKALAVRQAFFKVVPRQEMLDRLIKPISATATLDDSSLFIPGQKGYNESVKNNGSAEYQKVDVAGAKALLAKAGVTGPVKVKFAYANDNPRRAGEFQLIQASAANAGFNVVDVGVPGETFFDPTNGIGGNTYDYDASVFAYQLTSSTVTQSEANTTTGNAYNYQKYSNPDVDALWKQAEVATTIEDAIPLQQKIDAHLWQDASTLTLFQLPDVSAWSSNIQNVSDAPYSPNIFWNYFDWKVKK
jgi:peptide/nickel transport system substrate-binding protein